MCFLRESELVGYSSLILDRKFYMKECFQRLIDCYETLCIPYISINGSSGSVNSFDAEKTDPHM